MCKTDPGFPQKKKELCQDSEVSSAFQSPAPLTVNLDTLSHGIIVVSHPIQSVPGSRVVDLYRVGSMFQRVLKTLILSLDDFLDKFPLPLTPQQPVGQTDPLNSNGYL